MTSIMTLTRMRLERGGEGKIGGKPERKSKRLSFSLFALFSLGAFVKPLSTTLGSIHLRRILSSRQRF